MAIMKSRCLIAGKISTEKILTPYHLGGVYGSKCRCPMAGVWYGLGGGGGGRVWGRHKFTIPNTFLTHVINLLALGESTS